MIIKISNPKEKSIRDDVEMRMKKEKSRRLKCSRYRTLKYEEGILKGW